MPNRRKGDHVTGPHQRTDGGGWRIIVVQSGVRTFETFATESEARAAKEIAEGQLASIAARPIGQVIEEYEGHLEQKGNKAKTIKETLRRLRLFFGVTAVDAGSNIRTLTARDGKRLYSELVDRLSTDSHRNILAESKTFMRWCVEQRYIRESPLEQVKGVGKRKHGKPQLHIDEARMWDEAALAAAARLAHTKRDRFGPVAALMSLYMGLRASEIVERRIRDLDDEGRVLWIDDAKTPAGKRRVKVPEQLQPLLAVLVADRGPLDYIFPARYVRDGYYRKPHRDTPFVRKWVARICAAAGVPKVNAHSMRGLHGTLATEHGITGSIVAAALGHESPTTTYQSYAKPEAVQNATQARTLGVLKGGKR